jgi:predicted metal-binding protein
MTTTLYVCKTCKAGEVHENVADRPGARLHAAIIAEQAPDGVTVIGVECLSACSQGAAVALSEPGKWTYVYGRLTLEDAPDILAGAAAYAATTDGLVAWRARPLIFRKQSLARIPPLQMPLEAAE